MMKILGKITAVVMAAVISFSCAGMMSYASSSDAIKITKVEIVTLPNKTKFYQGTDWDYGYWDFPEGADKGTFVSNPKYISFLHNGGYYSHYSDCGMVDMTGLVVKVTYSDNTTANIKYKETFNGNICNQNIYVSPADDYKVGKVVMEVYFLSNTDAYDSYDCYLYESTNQYKLGDVNNDGKINSTDALLVLQYVVGNTKLSADQLKYADLNSDGKYNSADALAILRIAVGI